MDAGVDEADCAERIDDRDAMSKAERHILAPTTPAKGVYAAHALVTLASWSAKRDNLDEAVRLCEAALVADPTWPGGKQMRDYYVGRREAKGPPTPT